MKHSEHLKDAGDILSSLNGGHYAVILATQENSSREPDICKKGENCSGTITEVLTSKL